MRGLRRGDPAAGYPPGKRAREVEDFESADENATVSGAHVSDDEKRLWKGRP